MIQVPTSLKIKVILKNLPNRTEEMALSIKCLPRKPEELSSNPNKHIKGPGLVLGTWNPSTEAEETSGFLGPASQPTLPICVEFQVPVRNSISKTSR